MSILVWIIFGALAGWIASMLTRSHEGLVADIIVGIVGAMVGGFITEAFGASGVNGFNLYSLLVAVVGAVILLMIVNYFRRGQAPTVR